MKPFKIISIILLASIVTFTSCKKDAGPVGKKEVSGTVTYKQGDGTFIAAPYAFVYITYGTNSESATYDQTTVTDVNGKYSIKGLAKGDYYFTAKYTDQFGFEYTTAGYGVNINDSKSTLTLDISLE
ncbi:MAG TPA: carboxypeptidase-like regulatory domain-containing protein [Chitinophagales bacterium]|nr:carboxypeptidase-like regulatory domain-containing protein [Chitinophagales bacterium]